MSTFYKIIMSFSVSINFNGNCREVVTFYAKVFEQDIPSFLTYEEGESMLPSGFRIPDKMKSRVMRSCLNIAGTSVEFCDIPEAFGAVQSNSMFLSVTYKDYGKAKKIFDLLSQNGEVDVPYIQIGEDKYYGVLEDKFHMHWVIKAQLDKSVI